MLTIIKKDGNIRVYKGSSFTDYEWNKHAFIVIRGNQWIGIYNWEEVDEVIYSDEEDE